MTIDLDRVVIVNESGDPDRAGNVIQFKSIADAESYLEPIDVENGAYFAYLLNGRELKLLVLPKRKLFVEIDKVRIDPALPSQDHADWVRSLLEGAGAAVLAARKRRGVFERQRKPSAMSIVELTELIGFT
jgi:hypothetical protein